MDSFTFDDSSFDDQEIFEAAAGEAVEVGNRLAEREPEADPWDIADGMLSGMVHYWLFSRAPCENPDCEDCAPMATSERRLSALLEQVRDAAVSSDYFHFPTDHDAGRA